MNKKKLANTEQEITKNQEQINQTKDKITYYNNQLEQINNYKKTHPLSYHTANFFSTATPKKQFHRMLLIGVIITFITTFIENQLLGFNPIINIASIFLISGLLHMSFNYLKKQVSTTFQMKVAEQYFKEELLSLSKELVHKLTTSNKPQKTYQEQDNNKHNQQIKPINHDYDESNPKTRTKK